ncbi:hypothetical protein [Planktotalea arctica]|uniref:hypothetical protein n=1 Tax=Planktotalea arctica TaxID=1481893 RepID=UPI003218FF42
MRYKFFLTVLSVGIAAPLVAAAQFVPTLETDPHEVCPDRPAQPDWIENIDVREAHFGNLVQMMYRAQGLQAVSESEECTCETRFPSWDAAQKYYYVHYADLDRWEVLEMIAEYRQIARDHRQIAKPICEEQGNW